MQIGVIGISFEQATLELREEFLLLIQSFALHVSCVILSTCNRVELYFSHPQLDLMKRHLLSKIPFHHQHLIYSFEEKECFLHLATVTSGLKSALLAEDGIQRQVKLSYETARKSTPLPSPLHYLFQKCLRIGKLIRSSHPLFRPFITLEAAVFHLVHHYCPSPRSFLLIGYSETNRNLLNYFHKRTQTPLTVISHLTSFPESFSPHVSLKPYAELDQGCHYDVIISATTTAHPSMASFHPFPTTRLIIDLCMPRSLKLTRGSSTPCLTLDEITQFLVRHNHLQTMELTHIQHMIRVKVKCYMEQFQHRNAHI
ncbi:MAG: hypothetical protein QRY72_00230 [Candidatus Rhabdochlamydia sp.]